MLPRLGWHLHGQPLPLSALTVRAGTDLLTAPLALRREEHAFAPFLSLALELPADAAPPPADELRALLKRLWRVRWENARKEPFWRLVHNALPTSARMGDTTTPVKAVNRTFAYLQAADAEMKSTLAGVKLAQEEYDLYFDWRYQYGAARWRSSSMLRELRAGNYREACEAFALYKYQAGRDCSQPQNWGPRGCRGVWDESVKRRDKCLRFGGYAE